MSQSAFGALQSITDPSKNISLGNLRPNIRHTDPRLDMKERPWVSLLTIPASGSVSVAHPLSLSRIFKYESSLKPGVDVMPGESYTVRMDERFVGSTWWYWGDLEGDLAEKKLSEWRKG